MPPTTYKVRYTSFKDDATGVTETSTSMEVYAYGVITDGNWVTFHGTKDNADDVIAVFPIQRVIAVYIDSTN